MSKKILYFIPLLVCILSISTVSALEVNTLNPNQVGEAHAYLTGEIENVTSGSEYYFRIIESSRLDSEDWYKSIEGTIENDENYFFAETLVTGLAPDTAYTYELVCENQEGGYIHFRTEGRSLADRIKVFISDSFGWIRGSGLGFVITLGVLLIPIGLIAYLIEGRSG